MLTIKMTVRGMHWFLECVETICQPDNDQKAKDLDSLRINFANAVKGF